jgi:hypothetical protein
MTMPNFLIIGAAKSGTSSLHFYLAQHPEIYMTPEKQTYFFAYEGTEPQFHGPGDQEEMRGHLITRLSDYQAQFAGVTTEKAIGEACSVYLYDPNAPIAIKRHIPHVKLIVILRDPAERAYSSFMQHMREGYETVSDFGQALKLEEERIRNHWRHLWHYRARGYYSEQIQRYLELFDRSQLRIYLFEDLKRDPQGLLKDIFRFLGVRDDFVPDTSEKHNATGIPRSRTMLRLIMRPNALKTLMKPVLPMRLRRTVKAFVTTSPWSLRRPPMPAELRQDLVEGYREDIHKLQAMIGRDLSRWLT